MDAFLSQSDREDTYKVLGGLVGRAIGMPAQKPVRMDTERGRNNYRDSVIESLQLLNDSLGVATSGGAVECPDQMARALIDSGGFFWSKLVDDYNGLTEAGRRFSLEKMATTAPGAAEAIIRLAAELSWSFIAAEVQLLDWSASRGQRGRIDLLGWNADAITVVDVKTARNIPDEARPGDADQLRKYTRDLRVTAPHHRFKARVLYVDHTGQTETHRVNVLTARA